MKRDEAADSHAGTTFPLLLNTPVRIQVYEEDGRVWLRLTDEENELDVGVPLAPYEARVIGAKLVELAQEPPQYKHDCAACRFLGRHDAHDLYYCPQHPPTVLARYDNESSAYVSGQVFANEFPALAEAVRRAKALDLPLP